MTVGPTKLIAIGVGLLLVAGIAAIVLAKRHERRLSVAGALAVAALQTQVSNATGIGTARGIRIPFYEGDSKQPTSVMLGRTAKPVEGGRYLVGDLRVESYTHSLAGTTTNFVIEAPHCLIDPARKIASSAERMVISRPDGSFLMTGTGFEWHQVGSHLVISNDVSTHITSEGFNAPKPTNP